MSSREYFSQPVSAAQWYLRIRDGELDAATDAAFSEWMKVEANQRSFEQVELAWVLAEEVASKDSIRSMLTAGATQIPANWRTKVMRRARMVPRRAAAAIGFLIAAGVGAVAVFLWTGLSAAVDYQTAIGEQRAITLDDASVVNLNTGSHVRVRYSRSIRRVELLAGEAAFSVRKNKGRPFVVDALRGSIQATGTEFDVQIKSQATSVLVLEGSVRVQSTDDKEDRKIAEVATGQAVEYLHDGTMQPVQTPNAARVHDWEAHRLVFNDVELADAVQEYNRYIVKPIVLSDPALQGKRIYGVFKIGDQPAFLGALEKGLHVKLEVTDEAILVHSL